ncbi:MAG: aspartate-semialdehyde dehydrogenase [Spirochaetes bacterium GWD1_27_9]|nr:MAG: aspartate-semialdehyde dehydrogenase [Spirochaetes bacterium GWB1_27_13]OHD42032.1 MAG: aspartate-semialdehyde dehydrogenase [Spirochaetes bacterium GWD1_27_9]
MGKVKVGVLGATGTVGQKFITLLKDHPFFDITDLVASERSKGKIYKEACSWKQEVDMPEQVKNMSVKSYDEHLEAKIFFSGLDANVAGEIETYLAEKGCVVISNSKNHRMDVDVPISIPEINPEHFEVCKHQKSKGFIVTNSNCSTMFLAIALAPLHKKFGIEKLIVSTMQAVSGAGYPGVPSLDILGNVVPFIGGEEEKIQIELKKMLGTYKDGKIVDADFVVSAHCNRVAVIDGHTETVSILFKNKPTVEQVKEILANFKTEVQDMDLPMSPEKPIVVMEEENRPQPRFDVLKHKGMATFVGRIRKCPVFDIKMVVLGHNTIRGAAGAAILNAEYMYKKGLLKDII